MNIDNLEKMIQQYSKELLEMGKAYSGEAEVPEKKPEPTFPEPLTPEPTSPEPATPEAFDESEENTADKTSLPEDAEPTQAEAVTEKPEAENTSDSTATFTARVYVAEGAYPVPDAKVVVYKGDKIYAFLVTDENGSTKTVELPAFIRTTSQEKTAENLNADYLADVFAKGFESKKGLTISAEGNSEIVLDVPLTPESERIT
ncbi:MAG: hypothetical protein ACI4GC_03460 [Acutalibacteraceae bacterium]